MGIKSPITFGDYYWAKQVEAQQAFDESLEKALWPSVSSLFRELPIDEAMAPSMRTFINTLGSPPSPGFGDLVKLTGAEFGAELLKDSLKPFMNMLRRATNRRSRETWLTTAEAITLSYRKKIEDDFFYLLTASEGYEDIAADFLYDSNAPYPSIPDLMLYARYHGDPENTRDVVLKKFDVPNTEYDIWEWLGLQRLTIGQLQTLFRRGLITKDELLKHLAEIGWNEKDRPQIEELGWSIPNAMLLVQGDLQQRQSREKILQDISIADIKPEYAQTYLDAILTKPASQDIIAYHLRKDPTLTNLPTALRQIGIHEDFTDVYKTLAYPIPPVADIITMAVREAFSPEIAERFGQYEDYPPEFEKWALQKGLTPEWSKRYWAAHWSLPSPSQGFDMLHRGIINQDELNMLLRALDIMPFWREKLTGVAFRLLSRVDIRRMYRVGVMNEDEVYDAYLELGYSERDAKRMSDFTIKQALQTQAKFTAKDIVTAYTKYMISRGEARSLLQDVGVRSENIPFILSSAEYKRSWALTDDRIAAIKNLYKRKTYTADKARSELLKLDMPAERVDVLMEQWYIEEKEIPVRYWTTAQTISFVKAGIITRERGIRELQNIGYDAEHINAYVKGAE